MDTRSGFQFDNAKEKAFDFEAANEDAKKKVAMSEKDQTLTELPDESLPIADEIEAPEKPKDEDIAVQVEKIKERIIAEKSEVKLEMPEHEKCRACGTPIVKISQYLAAFDNFCPICAERRLKMKQ
jgi:hypothetical protein